MESSIVRFTERRANEHDLVGGKGANLGRLVAAGFPVPPGFSVTTEAYRAFVEANRIGPEIEAILAAIDYEDAAAVEQQTARIRQLLTEHPLPDELAGAVRDAYAELGDGAYVAVRSSGTAEDLADASFAGLHDTYLDIQGIDGVLDAIRRCWASLWTARATAYRQTRGFADQDVSLSVVVQLMVPADVSGVMFTANPITAAVDEIVINAGWGLGEGVVSGILTPDQYVVGRDDVRVRERTLGSKEVRVVRDPETGHGVVTEPVAPADAARFTLDDGEVARLAELGRRVTEYYDGFPQDMEWAYAAGSFYLLQSRDVTGVELSWDEDLEQWQWLDVEPDWVWSRAYADEWWTGAITPLMYSFRAREFTRVHNQAHKIFGFEEVAGSRLWKYHKGEAYFSCDTEKLLIQHILPPFLRRPSVMHRVPPSWWTETHDAPFSLAKYLRMFARVQAMKPGMAPTKWTDSIYDYIENRRDEAEGLSNEQLRLISDNELEKYVWHLLDYVVECQLHMWGGFFVYAPNSFTLLTDLLERWYDGDPSWAFADLCSGLPNQTVTVRENHELWLLAQTIKQSDLLSGLFERHEGAAFFAELENHEEGRELLGRYRELVKRYAHRGAADRDVWFPRRADDPGIDYNALRAMMTSDVDPSSLEDKLIKVRKEREDEVVTAIRRQPLGAIKAEIFKLVHAYVLKFLVMRDDEREYLDHISYSQRRAFREIARRLVERGRIETEDDAFFLGGEELFDVLHDRHNPRLTRAKVDGRRRNFLAMHEKRFAPPPFLQFGRPALPGQEIATPLGEAGPDASDGVLRGMGTSRGRTTGRARIVRNLDEIGTVEKGDILICNSTDPGWTPVFLVIKGLVLEAGGLLSHGACLSREYGFPAVQITDAINLIEDGSTITVDGDSGEVLLHDDERPATPELAESAK